MSELDPKLVEILAKELARFRFYGHPGKEELAKPFNADKSYREFQIEQMWPDHDENIEWVREGDGGVNVGRTEYRERAEAALEAIEAAGFTVSPLSDGDGWQPIETAPRDGTHIIVAGGVAYWRDGAWWTITGVEMPGTPIEWPVALWRPLGHPSIAENDAAIRALSGNRSGN